MSTDVCGMIHGHISLDPCQRAPGHDGYPAPMARHWFVSSNDPLICAECGQPQWSSTTGPDFYHKGRPGQSQPRTPAPVAQPLTKAQIIERDVPAFIREHPLYRWLRHDESCPAGRMTLDMSAVGGPCSCGLLDAARSPAGLDEYECGECGHDTDDHVHYCPEDDCPCAAEYVRITKPAGQEETSR